MIGVRPPTIKRLIDIVRSDTSMGVVQWFDHLAKKSK
jgi:hypothetical protein